MDKPAFSETVPNELRELGYVPPIIKSYDNNGINVWLDKRRKIYDVPFGNLRWMVFNGWFWMKDMVLHLNSIHITNWPKVMLFVQD